MAIFKHLKIMREIMNNKKADIPVPYSQYQSLNTQHPVCLANYYKGEGRDTACHPLMVSEKELNP